MPLKQIKSCQRKASSCCLYSAVFAQFLLFSAYLSHLIDSDQLTNLILHNNNNDQREPDIGTSAIYWVNTMIMIYSNRKVFWYPDYVIFFYLGTLPYKSQNI